MNILITGGAGFIGSNLVEAMLDDPRFSLVRVLDNLATGNLDNIKPFMSRPDFEFVEGDIRDYETCMQACKGIDRITHQAALGSVPRSIKDPLTSNAVNVSGTLNIFMAAHANNIDRVVYAASSSTYGDSVELPKQEDKIGKPLSPYAVTKLVNEIYADVFNKAYGTNFVGLRYFNVFGRNQSPKGAYAAVIPIFFAKALKGESPTINGDGSFSRDFTFIQNVVQANIKALTTENDEALNEVYNIAAGKRTTLNELWEMITKLVGQDIPAIHGPERAGDIPHSLASVAKAEQLLQYAPDYSVEEGLAIAYEFYKESIVV